jgi:hypothetical protein
MSKTNKQAWIWVSVLLVIFVVINYYSLSFKPRPFPAYVSNSPSPSGVKALYTYLHDEMGSKQWTGFPDNLPKTDENQLLVMVEPAIPNKEEMSAYVNFIKAGNTILLLKSNPKGMFDIGTVSSPEINDNPNKIYDENKKGYEAENSSSVRLENRSGDQTLLHDKFGIIALQKAIGRGKLIVSITPEWMTNEQLLKKDHLSLVLMLVEKGYPDKVLFDEYLHGNQSEANKLTVYPKWFLLMILQVIFLMILWLWYKGKRFGPISFPREEVVRFSDEGIQALTAWYLRGGFYHESIVIQAEYVKGLLQERWGISSNRDWLELALFFERNFVQIPVSEIHPLLTGLVQVLKKEKISKQEYLLWSRNIDRLRKEVEQG